MRELRDILAAYEALCERDEAGVLAHVVRTSGSTYRRPGARMLVRPDGSAVGLVGGGCLEGDLVERAREVRARGTPVLVRYEADREEDLLWGLGLGCGGTAWLLLERVDRQRPGPLGWLREWLDAGEPGAIATKLEGAELGWRAARHEGGRLEASSGPVPPAVASALEASARSGRSRLEGDYRVELAPAPIRLAIFGAGPDAEPLADAALRLGWEVVVADHRPAYAKPERFTGARVVLADAESAPRAAAVDARTHAVLMTHHFLLDAAILRGLLERRPAYIGVLGPRQRTQDLLARLRSEGLRKLRPGSSALDILFAPAGLDLGAESPEEIALAIVSEIRAVSRSRAGGFLRERSGPIHEPSP